MCQMGLANGVMGTIRRFEMGNDSNVKSVGVEFDHERVGRSNSKIVNGKKIVFIERAEETNKPILYRPTSVPVKAFMGMYYSQGSGE